MSVGGIRGGGKKGGPKGVGGASGKGGVGKAGGAGFADKVGKSESLVGASRMASSAEVGATDPVSMQALEIAKQLKSGQLKSRDEATKKLVGDILKQKLRMQSKALTDKIADALQDDPRLNQALERIWSKEG